MVVNRRPPRRKGYQRGDAGVLDYYGICYFNDVSKPANRITEEDMECDCGEYKSS